MIENNGGTANVFFESVQNFWFLVSINRTSTSTVHLVYTLASST